MLGCSYAFVLVMFTGALISCLGGSSSEEIEPPAPVPKIVAERETEPSIPISEVMTADEEVELPASVSKTVSLKAKISGYEDIRFPMAELMVLAYPFLKSRCQERV